jgi:hypothetical protein
MKIETKANVKILLHCAKYTDKTVFGFVVGEGDVVSDAFGVSHSGMPLSPVLEVSSEQIELYGKKIIGVYYFPVFDQDQIPSHIVKIASAIPNAWILMVRLLCLC